MRSYGRIVIVLAGLCGAGVIGAADMGAPGAEPALTEPATNPWPPPTAVVSWSKYQASTGPTLHLRLLAFNDFHGNLQSPAVSSARPVGGARGACRVSQGAAARRPGTHADRSCGRPAGRQPAHQRSVAQRAGDRIPESAGQPPVPLRCGDAVLRCSRLAAGFKPLQRDRYPGQSSSSTPDPRRFAGCSKVAMPPGDRSLRIRIGAVACLMCAPM